MKIDKIEVLTSNKKHATDIVMLVDKPEFILEIQRLRDKWDIDKLESIKGLFGDNQGLLDIEGIIRSKFEEPDEIRKKHQEFNRDIDALLRQFKRGKNFRQVVMYALVAGAIPDSIYESCYFDVVTINEPADLSKPERYQYVIVMSPRTEKKEVLEAFEDFKKHRERKIKFHQPRIPLDSPVTKEFIEAIECIEKEKKICEEKTKKDSSFEGINKALAEFFRNTEKANEYILRVGDLSIDIPEHKELIMQYHAGNVNKSAEPDKFRKKTDIDRIRKWYWMRYGESFNDKSTPPKTYEQVYNDWSDLCPVDNEHKNEDEEKNCQYCNIQSWNNIEVALKDYRNLLALS
jgi:uncharacterized coiled-coil DUF342 family protein